MTGANAFTIRAIEPRDDAAITAIIRSVMPEFGAGGAGFAIHDAEVAAMCAAYSTARCGYFVVEVDGVVLGGGGFAPLDAGAADICELRKMYFLPSLRGRGAGHALIAHCLDSARHSGFTRCYIETLTGMDAAQHVYLQSGFVRIDAPLGSTGHHGCDRFYLREL
ncbi:MAG: GNAT family N-acetyltransferase [Dokdonella sp.]